MTQSVGAVNVVNGESREIVAPSETVEAFQAKLNSLRAFVKANLVEGVDFGRIPGTGPKPTLLKPGAEKLLRWHGLVVDSQISPSSKLDISGEVIDVDMGGTVRHVRSGMVLGKVHANCNSEERRYRNARLKNADDPERESASLGDQKNTIVKICQKRLEVAAALLYTMASEAYTQDVEDTHPPTQPEAEAAAAGQAPVCEKCGKLMALRHRKSDGQPFWGCTGYPSCKGIRDYDSEEDAPLPEAENE